MLLRRKVYMYICRISISFEFQLSYSTNMTQRGESCNLFWLEFHALSIHEFKGIVENRGLSAILLSAKEKEKISR